MVVELCVVMPVMLMVSVIIVDMLVFASSCSRFDHLAPQTVIAVAASPVGTQFDPSSAALEISQVIGDAMGKGKVAVETQYDGRICTFRCEYSSIPWPLDISNGKMFGLGSPAQLTHSVSLAVRPYVIGEV